MRTKKVTKMYDSYLVNDMSKWFLAFNSNKHSRNENEGQSQERDFYLKL